MNRTAPAGIVMALALLSFGAWAAYVQDSATETWSGVSGVSGEQQHSLGTAAEYFGLRTLTFYDYDRRTCQVEVGQGALNGGKAVTPAGKLKVCEPRSSEGWKTLDVGSGLFITGIEVCTEKREDGSVSLRGVRVQGASIEASGSLKPAKAKTEVQFPGCKTWHPKKACPKGAVATGLRASYGAAEQGYIGLELRCHTLKRVPDAKP
jgi:hypothetical protein